MSGFNIVWEDNATPWLKWAARNLPEIQRSVLKSAGFQMKRQMEKGARSGAPAGKKYPKGAPPRVRKAFDRALGNQPKSRYKPLGRLIKGKTSLLRYRMEGAETVAIGWVGKSAEYYGSLMESGFTRRLSPHLRSKLHAEGVHIPNWRKSVRVAARPTVGPYKEHFRRKAGGVAAYMEEMIWFRLSRNRKMTSSQAGALWGRYCG